MLSQSVPWLPFPYRSRFVIHHSSRSIVFMAENLRWNGKKHLAVKQCCPEQIGKARLDELIDILPNLKHPSIPEVIEHLEYKNCHYFVTKNVYGRDLELLTATVTSHIPSQFIAKVGVTLCDVLSYLHSHEPPIVLNNLSPEHVIIDTFGKVNVVGFSYAAKLPVSQPTLPDNAFQAPEKIPSPLSDIYSLGRTMAHALKQREQPTPEEENQSKLLNDILMKASSINPQDRYQSAREMKAALEAVLQNA